MNELGDVLSEISQTQTNKYCITSLTWNGKESNSRKQQHGGYQELGVGEWGDVGQGSTLSGVR